MKSLFAIVLIMPLMTFLILLLKGRFVGTYGAMIIGCTNIVTSLCSALSLLFIVSFDSNYYLEITNWLIITGFPVQWSFRYDGLTALMFLVVTLVSGCVHIYSCVYMYTDPFLTRFISYLSLFTFFMLVLVSSANFLVLFVGWEGVGLCSYLLIGYWYTRVQAGKAATKAFLMNKIGDIFLLTAIGIIILNFHTLDYSTIGALSVFQPTTLVEIISVLMFVGVIGKSAQIGLHSWLPTAMEGPTPVSALIHAATMVTAGVFLIIRSSSIFEYAPIFLTIIGIWGGFTALISGTIGVAQNDIKKIIAYSTCSQLGYMVLAGGLSAYNVGFFHLFNHAFFKALLFLSAGSIIHLMSNEQDIRKMGGLAKLAPYIYINMLVASLALAGFPFLAGFFSKDIIIEIANTRLFLGSNSVYWLTVVSAIFTVMYSLRLLEQVFWGQFEGFKVTIANHMKVTGVEIFVLGILVILSITSGYLFKDVFTGFGSSYFNNSILQLPITLYSLMFTVEAEFLPIEIKVLPLLLTFLAFEIQNRLLECKWFFDETANGYFSLPVLILGRHTFDQYEKRVLELSGPLTLVNLSSMLLFNKSIKQNKIKMIEGPWDDKMENKEQRNIAEEKSSLREFCMESVKLLQKSRAIYNKRNRSVGESG